MTSEQRRAYRQEPVTPEQEEVELGDASVEGVVSNVSEHGICVIALAGSEFEIGDEVTITYRGHTARATVRNRTQDAMTVGYGLEWAEPIPIELLPHPLRIAEPPSSATISR